LQTFRHNEKILGNASTNRETKKLSSFKKSAVATVLVPLGGVVSYGGSTERWEIEQ
jgi:hypothetical protein